MGDVEIMMGDVEIMMVMSLMITQLIGVQQYQNFIQIRIDVNN